MSRGQKKSKRLLPSKHSSQLQTHRSLKKIKQQCSTKKTNINKDKQENDAFDLDIREIEAMLSEDDPLMQSLRTKSVKVKESKKEKKRQKQAEEAHKGETDDPDEFDARPRLIGQQVANLDLKKLPIQSPTGFWHLQVAVEEEEEEEESVVSEDSEDPQDLSICKGNNKKMIVGDDEKMGLEAKRALLKSYCSSLKADPDGSRLPLLKKIRKGDPKSDINPYSLLNDPEMRQETALALVDVFADLLPGYRVRPLTEATLKDSKVSKEVRLQWTKEQALLRQYQGFLEQDLRPAVIKSLSSNKGNKTAQTWVWQAVGRLLQAAWHFNEHETLLTWVVKGTLQGHYHVGCPLEQIFVNDPHGSITLEGVRSLSNAIYDVTLSKTSPNIIKMINWSGMAAALKAVLRVNLRSSPSPTGKHGGGDLVAPDVDRRHKARVEQRRHYRTAAEKKAAKQAKKEALEALRAEVTVTGEQEEAWRSETLKFLFRTYFTLLRLFVSSAQDNHVLNRDDKDDCNGQQEVLRLVMQGLALFASYLSVEYLRDLGHLVRSLLLPPKKTVKNNNGQNVSDHHVVGERLSVATAMQCINTCVHVFRVNARLGGHMMDTKFAYDYLFRCLTHQNFLLANNIKVAAEGQEGPLKAMDRVFKALFSQSPSSSSFNGEGSIPAGRVAAFVHRLASLSLKDPVACSPWTLAWMRFLLENHPSARCIIDPSHDGSTVLIDEIDNHAFLMEEDPDLSDALRRDLPMAALNKATPNHLKHHLNVIRQMAVGERGTTATPRNRSVLQFADEDHGEDGKGKNKKKRFIDVKKEYNKRPAAMKKESYRANDGRKTGKSKENFATRSKSGRRGNPLCQ